MNATEPKGELPSVDVKRIMELLPHRPPMLLIDRIVDIVPHESATGVRAISISDPIFLGHFPGHPIMPGVMIIEAMAQTAAVMVMETLKRTADDGLVVYFMSIDEARFRKPVVPGDTLGIHVAKRQHRGAVWKFEGQAKVGDVLNAEAVFTAMIVEPK